MVTKKTSAAAKTPAKSKATKSTAPKSTAPKSTAKPKAAAKKPAVKKPAKTAAKAGPKRAPAAASVPVQGVTLADVGKVMTKKQLFEAIKATSGVKGSDARKVMEAMLEELGAAMVRGETLKLQPLGTMKVQRQKATASADMVVLKLRRKKAVPGGNDPLAEAAE